MVFMLPLVVGFVSLAAGSVTPVHLQVAASKSSILVGEPVKLVLTWSTPEPTEVDPCAIHLFLDGRVYHEAAIGTSETFCVNRPLTPASTIKTIYIVAATGSMKTDGSRDFSLALPKPGRYHVYVTYDFMVGGEHRTLDSNDLVIDAQQPRFGDADTFKRFIQRRPDLLTEWATFDDENTAALQGMVESDRNSSYVARSQLFLWRYQLLHAAQLMAAAGVREPRQLMGGEVGRIMDSMEATAWPDNPFDEDRLLLLAESRAQVGDRKRAQRVYQEILAEYPNGLAAETARTRLEAAAHTR
jgi:hypothetical protein